MVAVLGLRIWHAMKPSRRTPASVRRAMMRPLRLSDMSVNYFYTQSGDRKRTEGARGEKYHGYSSPPHCRANSRQMTPGRSRAKPMGSS